MENLQSFYETLESAIKRKSKTRAKFEQTIATWLLNDWLTEDEAAALMELLNKYYPVAPVTAE